ncbi:hypothetical protein DPMN_122617 [Dreissena polymorpha]|uniref:Uncharacterized protein n=1 Tax=Dreissena polymorpha TaxID=45954 RepID=A0A9D4GQ06_DREPO|nr:hypothetical protein DPMN_122617 [Dreissena polymorpha]
MISEILCDTLMPLFCAFVCLCHNMQPICGIQTTHSSEGVQGRIGITNLRWLAWIQT